MKFFNTAGPVNQAEHYKIDPLRRFDLDEVLLLLAQRKYFVLHAPRQTGKTSSLLALRDYLNAEGRYRCVYANVEMAQAARENIEQAVSMICDEILGRYMSLFEAQRKGWRKLTEGMQAAGSLNALLQWLCQLDAERPLIVLLDEIDSLVGDTLISVLRQIRSGYDKRPAAFPQSIILCGVRDVRDYRIHTSGKEIITGGSAFNIKAESLRLGNFTADDIRALYLQHTQETGQRFEDGCFERVWESTEGQPWLVNALGYEATFRMKANRDRSVTITPAMINEAREQLILRRDTHLDQLVDKLQEPRVSRVMSAILAGAELAGRLKEDDVQYLVDLGLIQRETGNVIRIANGIYKEVIPRELTAVIEDGLTIQRQWFVLPDGRLDLDTLLERFQDFFRKHSGHWAQLEQYQEAGPHLLLQAFLQRVVNGGGSIQREYGLGRKRTDLYVRWPHPQGVQEAVLELKIQYDSRETTLAEALPQIWEYADTCGATETHLLLFDRAPDRAWDDKIFHRTETYQGMMIQVWGM